MRTTADTVRAAARWNGCHCRAAIRIDVRRNVSLIQAQQSGFICLRGTAAHGTIVVGRPRSRVRGGGGHRPKWSVTNRGREGPLRPPRLHFEIVHLVWSVLRKSTIFGGATAPRFCQQIKDEHCFGCTMSGFVQRPNGRSHSNHNKRQRTLRRRG